MLDEWELTREGEELWHGFCSGRAREHPTGAPAVLKMSFDGDDESEHEALALQHWHGDGVVRLLRADPGRRVLLLERLERRDLTEVWDLEACEMVAGLYPRIHRPALPQLRTVTSYVERWLASLAMLPATPPCRDGWSSRRCRSAGTSSPTRPASAGSSTATSTTRTSWPPQRRSSRTEAPGW